MYEKYFEIKIKYANISKVKDCINKFDLLNEQSEELKCSISAIEESLEDLAACKLYPSFENEKQLIQKFDDLNSEAETKKEDINNLEENINDYLELIANIETCKQKIKELKKQLPDVCPFCGAAMKDGRCVNE